MPVILKFKDPVKYAWFAFNQVHGSGLACQEEAFRKLGISYQQYIVLIAIKKISPPVTLSAVANWLDRSPHTITLIVDRMEKNGIVSRIKDLRDRRTTRVVITPEGERVYKRASRSSYEVPKLIFSSLTPEELSQAITIFEKMRETTYQYRGITDKVFYK